MKPKDFADEIDRARTLLQADYQSVTVSASYMPVILGEWFFISVKTPYWTHELEWREDDAPDMPLSEWIHQEVRSNHAPDYRGAKGE